MTSWTKPKKGVSSLRLPVMQLVHSNSDHSISAARRATTTLQSSVSSPLPAISSAPSLSSTNASFSHLPYQHFDPDLVATYVSQLCDIKKPKHDLLSALVKEKDKDTPSIFASQMEKLITALDEQRSRTQAATWASVFNKRSIRCKDILSPEKAAHLQVLLAVYLKELKHNKDKEDPMAAMRLRVVERLMDFFSTHEVDPDSCLIGLPPSNDALNYVRHHVDATLLASASSHNSSNSSNASSQTRPLPPNYSQLVSTMMEWSLIEQTESLKGNIEALCSSFRGVNNIVKGDVAVIYIPPLIVTDEWEEKGYVYARYTGSRKNELFEFFINPDESKRALVEGKSVFPVTPYIKEAIKDITTINAMVQNPADQFDQLLKGNIHKEVDTFLEEQGIHTALVKRSASEELAMKDLPGVRRTLAELNKLNEAPPELFLKEMGFYSRALVSVHTRRLAANPTFTHLLSREATVSSLRAFANAPIAQNRIKEYVNICEEAYEKLDNKAKDILSGSRKRTLTDWWLKKIEISTDQFLCKRNFDFDAVPNNYILEPPSDMKVVRENLRIIEGTLHSQPGEDLNPIPLIELLKSEIYPVIDRFIWDSTIVICDRLEIELDGVDQITIFSSIAEKARNIEKNDPVYMLIQDLKYLIEMKRLENVQTSEKLLHIVPIGGLVLNNFHRQWNELKTVIELWGNRDLPTADYNGANLGHAAKQKESRGQTQLHHKVLENDLGAVMSILADDDNMELLNVQDSYGWTPLHCCCHAGNLDMCMLLLGHEATRVTNKNTDGNTVLHYIVRHGGTSPIIQVLIDKQADVNATNNHSETALHYACMRGHEDIVEFLLHNGADPNATNSDGDSCLHYAVFVGKPEIVAMLLKFGAKRDVVSKKQGSPLDIAIKFKLPKIVAMLKDEQPPPQTPPSPTSPLSEQPA